MKPILVLYASREGQTRRIAQYLAAAAQKRGLSADAVDASQVPGGFSLENYSAAILSASVHCGCHEKELIDFINLYKTELELLPTVFLSISLSEAGAEDSEAPPERRAEAAADVQNAADVQKMIDAFLAETGWHPDKIQAVAEALRYRKYNFLLRFIMKRIAARAGGSTDTSRDHEYTDWGALDRLIGEVAQTLDENMSTTAR